MATLVSQPPILYTALRSLEYKFAMPSIGSGDIEKYLAYRIKNVTDNVWLTSLKFYKPVADGQEIVIDFYKDMYGINQFNPPPFGLPNVVFSDTAIIKTIEVEYGEREVDKGNNCAITDTVDGTTTRVDAICGIWRPWESQFPLTGIILTNRPKLYYTAKDSADWLYVAGTYRINVAYYGSTGLLIGSNNWIVSQTFPNSVVSVVPIGFQIAPAGTETIKVYAKQSGSPNPATDHFCTIKSQFCGCEETSLMDVYFVNHLGGIDLMSFDCTESKEISVAKEFTTKRYDKDNSPLVRGQITTNLNRIMPTINFKKQFDRLVFRETDWLDDFVSTPHAWLRMKHQNGSDILCRVNVVNGSFQTYGNEVELVAGIQFSEEIINPI